MLRRAAKRAKEVERGDQSKKSKTTAKSRGVLGQHRSGKDEAETVLEQVVLGDEEEILEKLDESLYPAKKKKQDAKTKSKPVWEDDDDDKVRVKIGNAKDRRYSHLASHRGKELTGEQYKHTLKNQFEKVAGTPAWAKLQWQKSDSEGEEEGSDDEDLLQKTGNYLSGSESLPKGLIQMKQCPNANMDDPSKGKLRSVEFHPTAQVMLTAGMDQTLRLFQIDGKNNSKIQSVFMDHFPIHSAHFNTEGTEVIMGSRTKNFYYYDMMVGSVINVPWIKGIEENNMNKFQVSPDGKFLVFLGKYGHMHLISAQSKEWITSFKMNGWVESIAFTKDGTKMFSVGDGGDVYVWDLNTRDCVHRFTDEGSMHGTSIAVSRNSQYIACGSYSGVVNIYDESCLSSPSPKPLKAVMNLTTPCTHLKFNSTTEILAMASNYTHKSVRFLHFPSLSVFSNFPDRRDDLRIPLCMDFSLHSGYFSLGNHKGSALLYRVKHYSNY